LPYHETEGFSLSLEPNRIQVSASADLAYAIGTYEYSVNGADGNPVEDRGKFLDTLRKQADGSWQLSSAMFNSDLPLTAPVD
jgi:ketosteroid isomerase-like protein